MLAAPMFLSLPFPFLPEVVIMGYYHYLNPADEMDSFKLPNIEIAQFTAMKVAESMEDTIREYMQRREYRLAHMNGRVRERMFEAIVADENVSGGFMYCFCTPGCIPDSDWIGPFQTVGEALEDARSTFGDY